MPEGPGQARTSLASMTRDSRSCSCLLPIGTPLSGGWGPVIWQVWEQCLLHSTGGGGQHFAAGRVARGHPDRLLGQSGLHTPATAERIDGLLMQLGLGTSSTELLLCTVADADHGSMNAADAEQMRFLPGPLWILGLLQDQVRSPCTSSSTSAFASQSQSLPRLTADFLFRQLASLSPFVRTPRLREPILSPQLTAGRCLASWLSKLPVGLHTLHHDHHEDQPLAFASSLFFPARIVPCCATLRIMLRGPTWTCYLSIILLHRFTGRTAHGLPPQRWRGSSVT